MLPYQRSINKTSRTSFQCVGCATTNCVRPHYGAPSCHGCKAFFRRTVFGGKIYICGASNACNTANEARNCCRACRMNNCLRGGMNPKLVREERIPTGGVAPSSPEEQTTSDTDNDKNSLAVPEPSRDIHYGLTRFLCALEKEAEMCSDIVEDENTACKRYPLDWSCSRVMQPVDIYSQWSRAFIWHTDWVMGIPEYRSLCLEDQTILFKNNFPTFGWITYAYKCYVKQHRNKGMPLGNGTFIPYNFDENGHLDPIWARSYGVLCQKLIEQVVIPMHDLNLSFEEYCILKTIALFQMDSQLTKAGTQICSQFKDRLMEALSSNVNRSYPHLSPITKSNRVLKIALLLPAFTHIGHVESEMIRNLNVPSASF